MSDSTQAQRTFKPLVKLTGLYENQSKNGEQYFTGFLGMAKIVILRDKQAEPGKTTWNLCVQEKEPKPDAGQPAQQGYHAQGRQTHPQQHGQPRNAQTAQQQHGRQQAYQQRPQVQTGYQNDNNLPF